MLEVVLISAFLIWKVIGILTIVGLIFWLLG